TPLSSQATASPSIMQERALSAPTACTISGKHPLQSMPLRVNSRTLATSRRASSTSRFPVKRNAPPKRGISVVMESTSRPRHLSSVKDADRQPLVTTGAGGGYLPIGALPTGHLPTGGGAGGGGSLRGRSAAAAALSIAKDAASAVRIFSMM